MAVRVTHIRMLRGGSRHEQITDVKWINEATSEVGSSSVASMVDYIDNKHGKAYVWDGRYRIDVGTVHPTGRPAYVRTFKDGIPTDNLLALPHF